MYEEVINDDGVLFIKYTTDSGQTWWIPTNSKENRMYQEYLLWKSQQ